MTSQDFRNRIFILQDEMFRFAKSLVVSSDEAKDVVQDLMLRFWQSKENIGQIQKIKPYVMRAVRNECLNRLRIEGRMDRGPLQDGPSEEPTPDTHLHQKILAFINELPERQRSVLHLRDVEGYELQEISELLQIEEGSVRVNLCRARQKVKEKINNLMKNEEQRLALLL